MGRAAEIVRKDCATPALMANVRAKSAGQPLARWYRWGWVPLVAGCAVIVGLAMLLSEAYLTSIGRTLPDPWLRSFFLARGVAVSALLATYAGWFVWRSRRRLEAAREDLRRRSEELHERERRAGQRASMDAATRILAHEIRNPLNNMLLNCTVLERAASQLPPDRLERVTQVCSVLRGEIERLTKLSLGYLSGRPVELHRVAVALESLATDVLEVYRPAIEARRLRVSVSGEGTKIAADPERLRQLLHNLVGNALDAVGDGGHINVRCARTGEHATLEVLDDGPGFAELDRAFGLFHTTKEHGTGLGLAVVRDVARMHGGEVEAANRVSGGASVTVRLPAGACP